MSSQATEKNQKSIVSELYWTTILKERKRVIINFLIIIQEYDDIDKIVFNKPDDNEIKNTVLGKLKSDIWRELSEVWNNVLWKKQGRNVVRSIVGKECK